MSIPPAWRAPLIRLPPMASCQSYTAFIYTRRLSVPSVSRPGFIPRRHEFWPVSGLKGCTKPACCSIARVCVHETHPAAPSSGTATGGGSAPLRLGRLKASSSSAIVSAISCSLDFASNCIRTRVRTRVPQQIAISLRESARQCPFRRVNPQPALLGSLEGSVRGPPSG